ncbi:MAG TPA: glycosyltransferase family 1 protein [candidate division Zixibacteria bacterium]|nr:glycosyltransferase family 1 protein [candidate division Zixibacteria bacterium]
MGADKKIRVCHLISGDLWAGAEVQAYTMLKALSHCDDLDIRAIVLNEGKLSGKLRELGIRVDVIDETKNSFRSIRRKLTDLLRGADIDIVHSHRTKENVLAAILKRKGLAGKLVQTVHGLGEPFKGWKKLKTAITSSINKNYTRRYFDRIHVVSDDIKDSLEEKFGADKLVTIHNVVDEEFFGAVPDRDKIREELGIDEGAMVLGTAGRMVPVKGYKMLIQAARIVVDNNSGVKFLLAGDGPLKLELERKADDMRLAGDVKFVGFRNDMIDFLGALDIFVMTSYHEGIPVVLLEAMALGRPTVATAVGGIREVIEAGKSGILTKPSDHIEFAETCQRLLQDVELRRSLGEGAKERIRSAFSSTVQREKIHKLYSELMVGQ